MEQLERGGYQPRRMIDGRALKRLAESIRSEGVIQPIFVRRKGLGKFEIIAGERRWHAAKMAGLTRIPTVVGTVSDETALAIALIENLHREDLNPIDQAAAMHRLVDEFSMTHQAIADVIGRSRATVSNLIRLLELPADVRDMVADGELEMGHARALLALPPAERRDAASHVAEQRLSVREVEAMVKRSRARFDAPGRPLRDPEIAASRPATASAPDSTARQRSHGAEPDARMSVRRDRAGRHHIRFSFVGVTELERAIDELRALARRLAEPADDHSD